MSKKEIPASTLARLPRYYRYARDLFGADVFRISSTELAAMMDVTASQIRQDLSSIGQFGLQGYGYNVKDLFYGVGDILGLNKGISAVVVGLEGLGEVVASQTMFALRGVMLRGLFDYDCMIGREISGLTVMNMMRMEEFCLENSIDIAVLCVPKELAPEACSIAIRGGVRGIWNLTGEELRIDRNFPDVTVHNLNLGDCLLGLCADLNMKKG